jgi:hypothetical protein
LKIPSLGKNKNLCSNFIPCRVIPKFVDLLLDRFNDESLSLEITIDSCLDHSAVKKFQSHRLAMPKEIFSLSFYTNSFNFGIE